MPTFFQKPENAIKRANEFIDVEKPQRALDVLCDVIKSKKHRTWQQNIHEPIMEKYLELCVELRKSHVAKEGLYQYKNICQQVNINSLVDVVRKYLSLAEEKTEIARQQSQQTVIDIDDLDVIQAPESLLLNAVSGEDTQDRTDRVILTPWVKFLWESYRQCLDLLRNNSSVEKLYQDIAQQAFKFCLKYSRKTEFRKLCENLRTHLSHVYKNQHQHRAINLNNADSQILHLETRLSQLDHAIKIELWQEAFKAVEDIHELMTMSKKAPKPSQIANYYQKLGLVFWKSDNRLFHAAALHRLMHLSRDQRKNMPAEDMQKLASQVLVATLAVPIPPSRDFIGQILDLDEKSVEKNRRLAALLRLSTPPTRNSLVKDLAKFNMIQLVHPDLQNLYRWLEIDFNPLTLSSRVQSHFELMESRPDLCQYVPALQEVTVTRLLKQISQLYQTIAFSRLSELALFVSPFRLERIIVDAARSLELQVRIDHRNRSLSFGTDLVVSQKEETPEGPYLQSMPSAVIRNQLITMATVLDKAMHTINPRGVQNKRDMQRDQITQGYRQTAKKEHQRILLRRQIIENRKEQLETMNLKREREEIDQQEELRLAQYKAEKLRLEREVQERERQRKLDEQRDIEKKVAKERLEQLKGTALGARVFATMGEEEMAELDPDEIVAKQVEQLEKEKKELNERLKSQEKRIDFFERAKRIEEIPLLKEIYEKEKVEQKELWEKRELERIERLKEDQQLSIVHRDRLSRMSEDKDKFIEKLTTSRVSEYQNKLKDYEASYKEERIKRMEDRKKRRESNRRQKWIQEQEEERQRIRDEELKRQREEEEKAAREAREAEEAAYKLKLAKLEEMEEKKRRREAELEEKEKQKKAMESNPDNPDSRSERLRSNPAEEPFLRGPPRAGGWREREKAREESWSRKVDPEPSERKPDTLSWRDRIRDNANEPSNNRDGQRNFGSDDRSPRDFGRRDFGRDGGRDFGRDGPRDSPRDFGRDGPRDFARDSPRDLGRDGPRDFGRDGPRDFGRDAPRDFGRDGPRDVGRDGPRDFGRDGPRDFGRDGPRDFGRDGPRDFRRDGGRDFRREGGRDSGWDSRRDFGRDGGRDGGRDFRDGARDFPRDSGRDFRDFDRDSRREAPRDYPRDARKDFGRESGRDDWRRDGDRAPDRGSWARSDNTGDRWGGRDVRNTRDERDRPREGDRWLRQDRGVPSPEKQSSQPDNDKPTDDGWTTVRH